jgi:hypothetical protein
MTAIEPFKVNASGPADVAKAVGGLGEAVGSVVGSLGGGSRTRAAVKMHQDQMVHEANMQQQHHENTLHLIDHVTNASMRMDSHQQSLREAEQQGQRSHEMDMQDRYVSHAKSLLGVVQPGTQTEFSFGGGSFKGISAVPARVSDDTAVQAARDRAAARMVGSEDLPHATPVGASLNGAPAMPREDSARAARLAAKVASNVKSRTQFPTAEPAAKPKTRKPRANKNSEKTEIVNIGGLKPADAAQD